MARVGDVTHTTRMPITVASRKGVSAFAAASADARVLLTSHGRTVAVVDSAERVDEDLRRIREAARLVVESCAGAGLERHPAKLDLTDVCARLGLDPARVRERAAQLGQA